MPINSIQFRAEIGIFNNKCVRVKHLSITLSNKIYNEVNKLIYLLCNIDFCLFVLSLFILCLISPLIIFIFLIYPKPINLSNYLFITFLLINILLHFIFNLLWCFVVNHRAIIRFSRYFLIHYYFYFQICIFIPFIRYSLIVCGDIESNPGPVNSHNLTICHWNLNGLAAHNFLKVSLLEAYNAVNKFDIICISETLLDSTNLIDDSRLSLEGYAMIRSDHPSNIKRGGVSLFYKEHLPFVNRTDLTFTDECIVGEIKHKNSKCFVSCFYRSPSQSEDEFNNFILAFEQTCSSIALESPLLSLICGDFNAKCTNWWPNGTNSACGLELYNTSTLSGYSQVINEPTNFQPNSNPSCIDLIFTNQPNLIFESGVHPSLSTRCHHQIIYAKISFEIYLPPSYTREVWHYKYAQTNLIHQSIVNFDWKGALTNLSINDQVELFNTTLFNIFRNFIPHETIKCNSKDPPWINKHIKGVLRRKSRLYKKYISGGRTKEDETNLIEVTEMTSNLISTYKDSYFKKLGQKLNDPNTSTKAYWSILKRFLNKLKIPEIPPLIENNVFITDFKTKANIFNEFFSN